MKYLLSVLCLGMLLTFNLNADSRVSNIRDLDTNGNGIYEQGEVDPNASYQSGPCVCYCPTTRFCEQKYCTKKCVAEPYTVEKKCCRYVEQPYSKKCCRYVEQPYEKKCTRMVPEYYTKQHCRYVKVPEYYEKTYCRQVPECYTKTCYRKVPEYYNEPCSRKVPEYYTTCETKYRNKWVKEEKVCYKPYTCVEKKCIDNSSCAQNGASQNNRQPMARGYSNNQYTSDNEYSLSINGDSSLNSTITDQINEANLLQGNDFVNVELSGTTAVLSGSVSSSETKTKIGSFVKSLQGIQNVENNIQLNQMTR